jgi:NAD(P)-dependent dehydrogenase (short-subunit alcohol dehydrogenase family)
MPLDPSAALLTDKVAVVTGAAQGIGRAIAETYARFGAHLAICDRLEDGLAETAAAVQAEGRQCVTGVLDVRDRAAVDAHVAEVVERFGRVDVLVNNAGGTFFADFLAVSDNAHRALVANNFTQVAHLVRACVPHMPSGGSIITVTSIEAHRAGPGFAVYSAMKAACTSLTQTLALELGERMIRVNTIAPDVITTPGVGGAVGAANGLPRPGVPDDCAGAAVFLASDLSAFVTGSTVHVDGGNGGAGGWRRAGVKLHTGEQMGAREVGA